MRKLPLEPSHDRMVSYPFGQPYDHLDDPLAFEPADPEAYAVELDLFSLFRHAAYQVIEKSAERVNLVRGKRNAERRVQLIDRDPSGRRRTDAAPVCRTRGGS